ncbi:MAG: alpha/beta hydrolase [Kiritimatiellae bacterium]|nr:alpha/beta hydrolase [Kiritimatiellia bacterium]
MLDETKFKMILSQLDENRREVASMLPQPKPAPKPASAPEAKRAAVPARRVPLPQVQGKVRGAVNALSMSLAMLALAGSPQERAMYVPGWNRCSRGEDEAFRFVAAAFPDAEVSTYAWDGNCMWLKARKNADAAAGRLADELAALPEEERERLTLVGHSLGGRIVVRALARLGRRGLKVRRALVMAAALPSDDADIADFAAAAAEPVEIVCNDRDAMLQLGYRPFGGEGSAALGAVGAAAPLANCHVSFVAPETVKSAPVAVHWAKIGWLRIVAAHYAPFYLEHIKLMDSEAAAQ